MKSIILIDVAGIFYQFWHATIDQPFGEAFQRTVDKVHSLAQGYDHAVVCYDWGPYKRKAISEAYKAQRDVPESMLVEQYKRARTRLAADGFPVLGAKGYEADDIIGTIVEKLKGKYEIRVASGDKDLAVLVSDEDHVSLVSTRTGEVLGDAQVREKFGVVPMDITDFLALTGDTADNIQGVKGVGKVMAAKIINSPEGLAGLLAGQDTEAVSPRIQELVRESRVAINVARQLVTLMTDAPVDLEEIFKERKAQPLVESNEKFEEEETEMPDTKITDAEFTDEDLTVFGGPSNATEAPIKTEIPISPANKVPDLQVPVAAKPAFKPEQQSTALAKVAVRFEDELEPRSLAHAALLSDKIVNSRLYTNFSNSDATLAIILSGREMGLRAMEALRCIMMVEGRPTLSSHLIIAKAKADPDCEYFRFIGGDDTYAEWETKHRSDPEPTKLRYTMDQAQQAGRAPAVIQKRKEGEGKDSRGNWSKIPAEMLRKSAAVQLARIVYPAASLGIYSTEELES